MLITTDNIIFLIRAVVLGLLILIGYYLIHIGNRFVLERQKIIFHKKKILHILLYVVLIVVVAYLYTSQEILRRTATVLIISSVFSYIINPVVDFFEKKGIKRTWSILLVYILFIAVFVLLGFSLIPKTGTELKRFLLYLPKNISDGLNSLQVWGEKFFKSNPNLQNYFANINGMIKDLLYRIQVNLISFGTNFSKMIGGAVNKLINIVMVPIVSYYLLKDKEKVRQYLSRKVSNANKKTWIKLAHEIDESMSQFIRGRLLMAAFVGVATSILLLVMGVDYALIIGLITGIADIIPYIGPFLGFIPAVIIAFIQQPIKALWVGLSFLLIQWAENNIIGPKLLGDSTGLHPLIVFLCLIVGGGMFGVMGMIFSVPVVAIFKIFWQHFSPMVRTYLKKDE